jgi:hypothetical protein
MTLLAGPASKPIGVYIIDGNDSDSMSGELFSVPLTERNGNAELKRYEAGGSATQAARPAKRVRVNDAEGGDCCDHGQLKYTGCMACEEEMCAEIAEEEAADPYCDHGVLALYCSACARIDDAARAGKEPSSEDYVPETPPPSSPLKLKSPPQPRRTKAFLKLPPQVPVTKWPKKARRMIIPDTPDREELLELRSTVRMQASRIGDLQEEMDLRDEEHGDLETRVSKLLTALGAMDGSVTWTPAVAAARDALFEYDL